MKALRGKVSNLSAISKTFDSGSCLSQTQLTDSSAMSISIGLRFFGSNDRGRFGKFGINEANNRRNNDDDEFFGEDSGKFNAQQNGPRNPIPGRPLRGERRLPPFQQPSNNNRRRLRDDSDQFSSRQRFSKPLGRESGNLGSKRSDDFFLSDDDEVKGNVGFGEGGGKKQESEPSISEFLSRGIKDEQEKMADNNDFLEQFKLKGGDRKEANVNKDETLPPEEEKAEEPPQDADVIFKKMKETGLIPNAVAMLDGLCKDGLVQEAMKLFGSMREKGTMPEVVIYTAVVDGFCQVQKLDDAKRIFRKMQNNGITPNAFSYGVLIRSLYKGKRLDDAVDFCVEMLEAGHSPNITTFTGLVDEFCKEKGVEEARNIVDALKQKGYYLDEKAVRDHLDKKGPSSPLVWDAIFGPNKTGQRVL